MLIGPFSQFFSPLGRLPHDSSQTVTVGEPTSFPQYGNCGRMPKQIQQLEVKGQLMMFDVFISYSRKDIESAQRFHHELETGNHDPWADWQDISPTSEWLETQM